MMAIKNGLPLVVFASRDKFYDDLLWQIQDAIDRANEKSKMDKMESDLASGLAILLAPILIPTV